MTNTLQITAANGVPFTVRIIRKGDRYGLNFGLVCGDKPLVEFYDRRYMHTEHGQFVSRYYVSTLLHANHGPKGALCLQGDVPEWTVDAASMASVLDWVREQTAPRVRFVLVNDTSGELDRCEVALASDTDDYAVRDALLRALGKQGWCLLPGDCIKIEATEDAA